MDLLKILGLLAMLFAAIEGYPLVLKNNGFTLFQSLLISFVLMAIKLFLEVFLIRFVGINGLALLIKKSWKASANLLRRHNILLINNWSTTNGKVVEISGSNIGKLKIVYRRPVILIKLIRRRIVKWIRDLGYLGLFIFSVAPLIPGIAVAVPAFYCLVTIKYKWYQFNNWWFVCFATGCEIRMISSVLITYGFL